MFGVCAWVCTHTCSCIHKDARQRCQQFSSVALYLLFSNRVSRWNWSSCVQLAWLACELWESSSLPVLFPPCQHWNQTCGQSCAWLLQECWGSKFKTSCWYSKLFPNWLLFLVLTQSQSVFWLTEICDWKISNVVKTH